MILSGLLLTALAAEPASDGFVDGYGSLASFEALECVEDWMQLCSPPAPPWLDVRIYEDRVEVTPWMADHVEFRIVRRVFSRLELEFSRCVIPVPACETAGKGATATVEIRSDGRAVWNGPSIEHIFDGKPGAARERVRVELVRNALYNARIRELERQYVPGGRCEGLAGYEPVGGEPCINAPGRKSAVRRVPAGDDSCGVERIRVMPFRVDEVGRDQAYDDLIAQGCAAVPCLVETIGSGKRMADPRQAPIFAGFRVGDAALFLAARITGRPFEESLPAEVRKRIPADGVQAYFEYVDGTSRRQSIRDDWRRWLAAHPRCR
jgi:hypothetical protein